MWRQKHALAVQNLVMEMLRALLQEVSARKHAIAAAMVSCRVRHAVSDKNGKVIQAKRVSLCYPCLSSEDRWE